MCRCACNGFSPEFFITGAGFRTSERMKHTQRLHSSSFLGLPYRILYMNPKKELLWSPWVLIQPINHYGFAELPEAEL